MICKKCFFFKQKTAYEMRISDWSSDVCSSYLREPLLAAGEVGAVEGVGFLGGGEAGILAQRPGPAGVHGRLGPTGEGREAGQASKRLEALEVLRGVERLHRDAFGRVPDQAVRVGALQLARRQLAPVLQRLLRPIGHGSALRLP